MKRERRTSIIARPGPIVLLGISCLVGCTKIVTVEVQSAAVEATQPTQGGVCPYSELFRATNSRGPYVAITLLSESDLEVICRRMKVHHLYFRLFACSSQSSGAGADLLGGAVFQIPESGPNGTLGEDVWRYKVFVPASLIEVSKHAAVIGTLDVSKELDKARESGLCISLGGGNMLGFGVLSNSVRVPIRVENARLAVENKLEEQ